MRHLPSLLLLVFVVVVAAACRADDGSLLGAVGDTAPAPSGPAVHSPTTMPSTTTTQPAPPSTTTTTTLPPLVMGFAGDTAFTHGLASYDPLGEVAELLAAPSLTLVNLETTIAEPDVGRAYAKKYIFKSPPESTGLLTAAGVDGVALGNNHLLDFGPDALLRTLELLDEAGLERAGAGADKKEAYAPMLFEAAGRRIAVLSFSRILSQPAWAAAAERPGIASAYPEWLPETVLAVEEAAVGADVVVVMTHWGIELNYCPEPYQREFAAAWVEAGADLVIGSHPHVLQGVEQIGDAWVVHSTGNFAFPSARGLSDDSAIFEITIDGTGTSVRAHPVHIINGRPHPATDGQAEDILGLLSAHSFGLVFDEDGVAIPSNEPGKCG